MHFGTFFQLHGIIRNIEHDGARKLVADTQRLPADDGHAAPAAPDQHRLQLSERHIRPRSRGVAWRERRRPGRITQDRVAQDRVAQDRGAQDRVTHVRIRPGHIRHLLRVQVANTTHQQQE